MKIHYCKMSNNNFGDMLNEHIFKTLFGIEICHARVENADVIGIGSVLEKLLARRINALNLFSLRKQKEINIFSSGFGICNHFYLRKGKYLKPLISKRKINVIAIRGQLSKAQPEEITGQTYSNAVLGDGGLLACYLTDYKNIEKKYDLGIVPHYTDKNNPVFLEIQKQNPNSIILDVTADIIEFIKQLASCKAVISTAMHPLIACDSMGIPNLWVRCSEKTTTRYKFMDYYSAFGLFIEPFILNNNISLITKDYVVKNYKIDCETVKIMQRNLIDSFNSFLLNTNGGKRT